MGLYLSSKRFWIVGKGFNEYDKKEKQIRVFRWGFPGKKRYSEFSCSFADIKTLSLESENSIFKPNLYLVLKEQIEIPLTQLGSRELYSSPEMEYFSATLARFLKIPLGNCTKNKNQF